MIKCGLFKLVLLLILYFLYILPAQAIETYQFDPDHTYILWRVNHFGFSNLSGKFIATGTLLLEVNQPQNSKVNITIDTANLSTGINALDDVLKGRNFFDVDQYPTATFVSNKVQIISKTTAKVFGILSLRGVNVPVILNVTLNKMGIHPYYNKQAVGFSADAVIKRSEFGMTGYLPGVADDVSLDIEAEAELMTPAPNQ